MERQERLELGEKFLVFAVMAALGVEGLFAILGPAIRFSWFGLVYAWGSAVFVALLANNLYVGNRTAIKVASGWAGVQVMLNLSLVLFLAFGSECGCGAYLAMPVLWMAIVKFLVYVNFAAALFLAPRVRDFFEERRGEELTPENPLAPTGVEVTFAEDQKEIIGSLGSLMYTAGILLIVVGVLSALVSFGEFINIAHKPEVNVPQALALWFLIRFLPALANVAVGILMFQPSAAAKLIKTQGTDMSFIMNALIKLKGFFYCLTVLNAVQLLGLVLNFPLF